MRRSRTNGFTLIEVLVVLAILVSGFVALTQLQTAAIKESAEAEEKTSVQVCCQNELDKILGGIAEVRPNELRPIPGFDGWTMTVLCSDAPVPGLVVLRVAARKSEYTTVPADRPGVFDLVQKPIAEVAVTEWADPDRIRIAGRTPSAETADQAAPGRRRTRREGDAIGSLSSPPVTDPFAAFDRDQEIASLTAPADPFAASGFESPSGQIGGVKSP